MSRLKGAHASVQAAIGQVEGAKASVQAAKGQVESSLAAVQAAKGQVESAKAAIASARGQVESAKASVQSAKGQVESAKAAVVSAEGQVEGAKAAVASAEGQVEGAKAGVETAKGQIETSKASVEAARSGIESADAGVITAVSALEGAKAGIQSANSQIEGARAGIQSAEATVAAADKEIERLEIHAPFAGLLESDTAELGALLQPGGLCATVIQLDPIKLVGFVPETEVDKVRHGAIAGARLATGRQVVGKVTFLSRSADPATRTFRVEVAVPNTDLSIRDGQTAEIVIEADGLPGHLIPQSALTLDDDGALGVRIVDDQQRAGFLPVAVLRDTLDGIYVSGLGETANIIVVGQEYVTDGVPVAPTFREAAQ
ncbi:MAG: efflux RND transporter periplasmic adaptor subunit [Rhodobacteraceae bacterium]|nr:efflux RND transporter periplasmic adaptor subunit [Paracoccaceae bacterium]